MLMELPCYSWLHGGIPESNAEVSRLLGVSPRTWKRLAPLVIARFVPGDDGLLVNSRQEEIRRKQQGISNTRAAAAEVR